MNVKEHIVIYEHASDKKVPGLINDLSAKGWEISSVTPIYVPGLGTFIIILMTRDTKLASME